MKFKKSLLTLFIVILSLCVVLFGCGKAADEGSKDTPQGTASEESPKQEAETKTVTLELSSWRTEDVEPFNRINEAFNKKYPNIKVEFKPIKNTEYDAQIKIALESGEGPDLLYLRPYDAGRLLASSGVIMELTPEMVPALKDANPSYLEAFKTDDGKIYALPGGRVMLGFLYNKKIFQEYGLEEPKTWDEFYQVCEKLQENGVRPIAMGFKDAWTIAHRSYQMLPAFIEGNAEEWRRKLLNGEVRFTDESFVNHLACLNKMKEYCGSDFLGLGYVDTQQLFLAEQAAIFPGGSFEITYFRQTNPDLEFDVFATPSNTKAGPAPVAMTPSWGYSINKNTRNVDECLVYLNWLATPEAAEIIVNELPGMPPMIPGNIEIEDEIMKKWSSFVGEKGDNVAMYWAFDKLNSQVPTGAVLIGEAVQMMWQGDYTPEQAAEHVQKGISTWYEPHK
ncbi:MAG TPA: extracellular solute-binding protein [Clostridiaceae bacterium]|nr:extracellular solute-binding protein [Clostridiaceae bacterium]